MPEDIQEEHESYGLVTVHRTNHGGGLRLFGSHINNTHSIEIKISHASIEHSTGREWYFGRKPITIIRVSEAQWASILSSFNQGSGTPCTIEFANGKRMEEVPERPIEAEQIRLDFEQKCKDLAAKLKKHYADVDKILEKKSITKADKASIKSAFTMVEREIRANMPYMLESFQESAEKVVTHAKHEVDGFMTSVLQKAGLKAIESGKGVMGLFGKE